MLEIRQYQSADHDTVWKLHNTALHVIGAHAGNGSWDNDFQQIEKVYLNNGTFSIFRKDVQQGTADAEGCFAQSLS